MAESNSSVETPKRNCRCEVCGLAAAKYTCPKCLRKTCCLACVKLHKQKENCNGERNKTSFIDVKEFTELHLRNDIRFLDEIKSKIQPSLKASKEHQPKEFSLRMKYLIQHARERGVQVALMPKESSRHACNTSIFMFENRTIQWRVEWIFKEENLEFIDERFPDVKVLQEGIDHHVEQHEQQLSSSSETHNSSLQLYSREGERKYHIYLSVFGYQKYYKLDSSKSLLDNLKGKCVVEFPSLYIVTDKTATDYPVLSAEEEEEVMAFVKAKQQAQQPAQRKKKWGGRNKKKRERKT